MVTFTGMKPGDPVVALPWNDGALDPNTLTGNPPATLCKFAEFDGMGLAITQCGMRQESRSNGWAAYPANDYQRELVRSGTVPLCPTCYQDQDQGEDNDH